MQDIKCPHCHKVFKVDEAGFADILKQVRDQQFDKELHERLEIAEGEKATAVKLAEFDLKSTFQDDLAKKDKELAEMKAKLDKAEAEQKLSVAEAVKKIEKERDELAGDLKSKAHEMQILEVSLKDTYETKLKAKDEVIERYKDMKLKLSTKMVGETLEQHCEVEFNRLRATAFQNAYFEKDNDASSGNKGDYIYRETDDSGNEIISIMFEMKNE